MPRIPEETIQQVLSATDIVDLVGRYVKLRRVGSTFRGLCPFHTEKTPSFYVTPSRNTYHCFGCGAGGSAIRFVMEHDGLTFVEAVKRLADAAGIRIEEEVWDANAEKTAKLRAALLRAHQEIAAWYHQLLMRHEIADAARQYLRSRGMNADIAKRWQLGYAPASGDMLREWAAEKKFSEGLLLEAGLMGSGDPESGRPGTYPRFRHRLMFPIRNENGEVIGFSGRLLDPNAKTAKYLNSPETPLFSKSRVLFGFDKSRRAIAKAGQAVIVEGQIDLITVFESGIENVVASQGTAFTEFHARLLKRHSDEIVLCFDSDTAGYKAAERAFQTLAPTGLHIKVAALPQGEDPDSLIRKQGREAFGALVSGAKEFIDFQIDHAAARGSLSEMRERVRFADEMAANVRLMESPVARETAIQKVAVRLGIPEQVFRRQTAQAARQPDSRASAAAAKNGLAVNEGRQLLATQDRTALLLCRLALSDSDIMRWLRSTGRSDILADIPGSELLSLLWHADFDPADGGALSAFLSGLDGDTERAFAGLLTQPMPPGGKTEAEHLLDALETTRLHNLIQRTQTQLKQSNLDAESMARLHQQIVGWRKEYLDRRSRSPDIR